MAESPRSRQRMIEYPDAQHGRWAGRTRMNYSRFVLTSDMLQGWGKFVKLHRPFCAVVLSSCLMLPHMAEAANTIRPVQADATRETDEFLSQYSDVSGIRRELANHPERVDEIFQKLTVALVSNVGNHTKLLHARNLFSEVMWDTNPADTKLSRAQANLTADTLLDLYLTQRKEFPDGGRQFIDFVAKFGETPKVKTFLLDILNGRSAHKGLLQAVTVGLYWGRTFRKDPAIFNALLDLCRRGPQDLHVDVAYTTLAALSKIDIDRATPVLRERVQNAPDIFTFNKVGSIISDTHSPELMEAVFSKYYLLKPTNSGLSGNPSIGIYKEAVVEYLQQAEDRNLERGLDILFRIGGHPPLSRTVLIRKLHSSSIRSRKAVLKYLRQEVDRGVFTDEGMSAMLDEFAVNEKDRDAAITAQGIASDVRKRRLKIK